MSIKITSQHFGQDQAGNPVKLFRITNTDGAYIELFNYACTIKGIHIRDGKGNVRNVIAGFESFAEYEEFGGTLCAVVGEICKDGIVYKFPVKTWEVVDVGDCHVDFSCGLDREENETGVLVSAVVRVKWVDYERLVIDITVRSDEDIRANFYYNMAFRLQDAADMPPCEFRTFSEWVSACDKTDGTSVMLQPVSDSAFSGQTFHKIVASQTDKIFGSANTEIHPMIELKAPVSQLSISAYTTMSCAQVKSVSKPVEAVLINEGCLLSTKELPDGMVKVDEGTWAGRIIYGFDRIKQL